MVGVGLRAAQCSLLHFTLLPLRSNCRRKTLSLVLFLALIPPTQYADDSGEMRHSVCPTTPDEGLSNPLTLIFPGTSSFWTLFAQAGWLPRPFFESTWEVGFHSEKVAENTRVFLNICMQNPAPAFCPDFFLRSIHCSRRDSIALELCVGGE